MSATAFAAVPTMFAFIGGIGVGEMILILAILLLVFGAGKLPQIGEALGKGIKNFKNAATGKDDVDVTPKKQLADKVDDVEVVHPVGQKQKKDA